MKYFPQLVFGRKILSIQLYKGSVTYGLSNILIIFFFLSLMNEPQIESLTNTDTPRLVNVSEPQTVENHERARLYCHYEGNPKPTVRWFYINPRSGEAGPVPSMKDGNHFLSELDQVLEIRNASYSHEGKKKHIYIQMKEEKIQHM